MRKYFGFLLILCCWALWGVPRSAAAKDPVQAPSSATEDKKSRTPARRKKVPTGRKDAAREGKDKHSVVPTSRPKSKQKEAGQSKAGERNQTKQSPAKQSPAKQSPAEQRNEAKRGQAKRNEAKGGRTEGGQPERLVVYLPYRKLGALLQQQGIFLTRAQFRALKEKLRQARLAQEKKHPLPYLLERSTYRGQVQGESIRLHVEVALRLLEDKGWRMVPLPFAGLPLLSARLDGKPAFLFTPTGKGKTMMLLLRGKGEHRLQLTFGGRVERREGWRSMKLRVPPTPQTRIRLYLGGKGWQVRLNGQKIPLTSEKKGQREILETALGPRRELRLRWFPKKQHVTSARRIYSARVNVETTLEEGLARSQVQVKLHVLRGKVGEIALQLPQQHKIIAVEGGTRLKSWSLQKRGVVKRLVVLLHQPLKGRYLLRLELEKVLQGKEKRVRLPAVAVEGARWQHGWLALRLQGSIQLKLRRQEGVTQMDATQYALQTQSVPPAQAFAYLHPRYQLEVELQRIKPKVRATLYHRLEVDDDQAEVQTRVRFRIKRAGVFQLAFDLPTGWELRQVRCPLMQDHYTEKKRRLVVVLKEKVGGPVQQYKISPKRLWLGLRRLIGWNLYRRLSPQNQASLRRRLERPKAVRSLQRLFGVKAERRSGPYECTIRLRRAIGVGKAFALPFLRPLHLEHEKGLVGLLVPRHLDILTSQRRALMSLDDLDRAQEVSQGKYPLRQAFRYAVRPVAGKITLKRKTTAMESQIWLPVTIREDGYRLRGKIRYRVRFAATDKLHLSVPQAWDARLQLLTQTREVRKKKKKDRVEYTLLLAKKVPRGGFFELSFVYHHPFSQAMKVGETQVLTWQPITTPQAQRQTLYWGLQKGESLSLQVLEHRGMERFDADELPPFATPRKMARLFQTQEKKPPVLRAIVRKHRYARVLAAVVSRLHLHTVLTREGEVQVLALLRVKNRGRQFLKVRLPQGAKVLALRVAGLNRYRLELDRQGELLIDLVQRTRGRPFLAALRYQYALPHKMNSWSGSLGLKGLTVLQVPVLQTTCRLYLPSRYAYNEFTTQMWHRHNRRGAWNLLRGALWGQEVRHHLSSPKDVYRMLGQVGDLRDRFPGQGQTFRFYSRANPVSLQVHYRQATFQGVLEFLVALVLAFLLFWIERRQRARWGPLKLTILSFVLLVFLSAWLPPSLISFTYAAFLSLFALASFWTIRTFVLFLRHSIRFSTDDDEEESDGDDWDGGGGLGGGFDGGDSSGFDGGSGGFNDTGSRRESRDDSERVGKSPGGRGEASPGREPSSSTAESAPRRDSHLKGEAPPGRESPSATASPFPGIKEFPSLSGALTPPPSPEAEQKAVSPGESPPLSASAREAEKPDESRQEERPPRSQAEESSQGAASAAGEEKEES